MIAGLDKMTRAELAAYYETLKHGGTKREARLNSNLAKRNERAQAEIDACKATAQAVLDEIAERKALREQREPVGPVRIVRR
jgi:hypothetical protein